VLTLLVPTKNRPELVERVLRYYAETGYRHWLFIGDSSDPAAAERTSMVVTSFQSQLKVVYHPCPGLDPNECLEALSQLLTTPYTAFLGDDDFLCTQALTRCIDFLESHPAYGAAHGEGLILQVEGGTPYGAIGSVGFYPQPRIESESGSTRLIEYLTRTPALLLTSVHRTSIWKAMFHGVTLRREAKLHAGSGYRGELSASCIAVIRGKVKEVEGLSLVRQTHDRHYHWNHIFDRLTSPNWWTDLQFFQGRLIEELTQQDGLNTQQAQLVVRQGLWAYFAKDVIDAWQLERRDGHTAASVRRRQWVTSLRQWAKRISVVKVSYDRCRRVVQRYVNPYSLPALLRPSSPHYANFLPIYKVISESIPR